MKVDIYACREGIKVNNIATGNCFEYEGEIYMKMLLPSGKKAGYELCVNLETGIGYYFEIDGDGVFPVSLKVVEDLK